MITLKIKDSWIETLRNSFSDLTDNRNENNQNDLTDLKTNFRHKILSLTDDDLGSWSLIKTKLKQNFSTLTDDDLYLVEGREDDLIDKLQRKIGDKQRELQSFIQNL